ncbi:MAG: hypothetical protein INR71_08380, partial [Terriglobus roseus]|nr:hypothetical protein [Terriglobus roseus]
PPLRLPHEMRRPRRYLPMPYGAGHGRKGYPVPVGRRAMYDDGFDDGEYDQGQWYDEEPMMGMRPGMY